MMETGWHLSSSDDEEDNSLLPIITTKKQYASPTHIKDKLLDAEHDSEAKCNKPECSYGKKCYRQNPLHFEQYHHSHKQKESTTVDTLKRKNVLKDSSVASKTIKLKSGEQYSNTSDPVKVWESSAPNYFLLTTCKDIPPQYNYLPVQNQNDILIPPSLGISEILSQKFGKLKQSAQFNYCIDINWLIKQYPTMAQDKPLLIVHGEQGTGDMQLRAEAKPFSNIRLCKVDLPPYGTHHTKMMLLLYEEGLRVVISTANLVAGDWNKKTQGFFMSPNFKFLHQNNNSNSDNFKNDLVQYLMAYNKPLINMWVNIVKNFDMSCMKNIRLIGSVPGRHTKENISSWGHMKLRKVLKSTIKRVDSGWPVIGQFSSIGSLGISEDKWLCNEWLTSLASCDIGTFLSKSSVKPPLKLIFPTIENVRCSLEGYPAGASLPYSSANAAKQKWLQCYLHQWKSSHSGRSESSPHIKTYTRISPYETNIRAAWFLLTSANLSKAAWGALEKQSTQLAIRSFELGVLFLPREKSSSCVSTNSSNNLSIQDTYFHIKTNSVNKNRFPLPFTVPLIPYGVDDFPWTWDSVYSDIPDRHGNVWVPT